jgi:hypothetical protein
MGVTRLEGNRLRSFSRISLTLLLLVPSLAFAGKPNWIRHATSFPGQCQSSCPTVRVVAPDKSTSAEVLYQDGGAYLRVAQTGKPPREIHDVFTSPHNDLLWSPDSKAFFVDAGEGMTSPSFVQVYLLDDEQLRAIDVTPLAEQDMVQTFPPAIIWSDNSSALVVLAQVPCTSNYGGISCQSMGYEVEVPSGKILKRLQPAEFKKTYQKFMEQKYDVPIPPQYVEPLQGR